MARSSSTWQPGCEAPYRGGRTRRPGDVQSLARRFTIPAIRTLAVIAQSGYAPPAARVAASVALLDRGWGRAPVMLEGGDGAGEPGLLHLLAVQSVGDTIDAEAPDAPGDGAELEGELWAPSDDELAELEALGGIEVDLAHAMVDVTPAAHMRREPGSGPAPAPPAELAPPDPPADREPMQMDMLGGPERPLSSLDPALPDQVLDQADPGGGGEAPGEGEQ